MCIRLVSIHAKQWKYWKQYFKVLPWLFRNLIKLPWKTIYHFLIAALYYKFDIFPDFKHNILILPRSWWSPSSWIAGDFSGIINIHLTSWPRESPEISYPRMRQIFSYFYCLTNFLLTAFQRHLSDSDFCNLFGITKDQFASLPQWKQLKIKKDKGMFW